MSYHTDACAAGEVDGRSEELPDDLRTPFELTSTAAVAVTPIAADDPVKAGLQLAVSDAVDTIVDLALGDAATDRGAAQVGFMNDLNATEAASADPTGWAGARMASLQAAAATAVADMAKSIAETGMRRAKEQATAAAQYSTAQASKAAAAAHSRGSQLATATQEQAARSAAQFRTSGTDFVTAATSNARVQKLSRKAREATELQARQAARLHRRRAYLIFLLAAIVGMAVGLYEKRRRAAAAPSEPAAEDSSSVSPDNGLAVVSDPAATDPVTEPE